MRKGIILIFFICILLSLSSSSQAQDVIVQTQDEKTITLDVRDMEISDVLRMIADQSGLNIIASKNVKGLIAISFQNVPVERALDAILKVNNCGYVKDGNIIQVYTYPELSQKEQFSQLTTRVFRITNIKAIDLKQTLNSLKSPRGTIEVEPKTNSIVVTDTRDSLRSVQEAILEMDKKLETKVYRLSYAKPAQLQKTLQGIIPPTEGDFLVDERTNSLIITASPVLLSKMDTLISNWDKQIPQVLIEARIMQITLDKNRFLGVEWQYQSPDKYSVTIGAKNLPLATGATYVDAFKIGVLGSTDYQVTLRALEKSSGVDLISSPRIVTLDNTEAKILIGSSEPYEVFHYDAEGHVTGKEIKFVEVGIKLIVTPKISEDGYITMSIHPEVSSPRAGTVTDALAVDTTQADTVMTVKDGNTVVLGGLIKDDKQEHVAKVPLLGDIPLIKYLFRNTYTTIEKKEIIIFITPKIINPEKATSINTSDFHNTKEQEMKSAMDEISVSRRKRAVVSK